MVQTLLLEIGVEELPASFVERAIENLPVLLKKQLASLHLSVGDVKAMGTPRRLTLWAEGMVEQQPDLDEEVVGPPTRIAFKAGLPTRAAESFAQKAGVAVDALYTQSNDKGEYIAARRQEKRKLAAQLLPNALSEVCAQIACRK